MGYFNGRVTCNGSQITSDGFIAKYSPSGGLLWLKRLGGYSMTTLAVWPWIELAIL